MKQSYKTQFIHKILREAEEGGTAQQLAKEFIDKKNKSVADFEKLLALPELKDYQKSWNDFKTKNGGEAMQQTQQEQPNNNEEQSQGQDQSGEVGVPGDSSAQQQPGTEGQQPAGTEGQGQQQTAQPQGQQQQQAGPVDLKAVRDLAGHLSRFAAAGDQSNINDADKKTLQSLLKSLGA